jgi:hypothetical protein
VDNWETAKAEQGWQSVSEYQMMHGANMWDKPADPGWRKCNDEDAGFTGVTDVMYEDYGADDTSTTLESAEIHGEHITGRHQELFYPDYAAPAENLARVADATSNLSTVSITPVQQPSKGRGWDLLNDDAKETYKTACPSGFKPPEAEPSAMVDAQDFTRLDPERYQALFGSLPT